MAGQSIGDRIMAAQHTIIGSDMSKGVCKASTHEIMGPKKKHLEYLNALTHEPNINIPELADFLVDRSKQSSWVVVFKALITTHHLMCYGNERFLQHLASRNSLFNLVNFVDKSGVQGYDMSTFIRRYAKYLNEKAVSYRTVAYDFTRAKRGKENGILRTLPAEKLLKTLPVLQNQLDSLLAFDANANELSNGVINSCFMLLFKDIIRLFASYNDGIINLLEKYFDMKKPQCKEGLDIYKKFLTRMSKVSEFLKVAEQVGIDKGDIPDLAQAPNSLLDALEQHLNAMDGKKGNVRPSDATTAQVNSFTAASSTFSQFDAKQTQETLKEEAERLQAFKEQKEKEKKSQQDANVTSTTNGTSSTAQPSATAAFSVDFTSTDSPVKPAASNDLFDLNSVFSAPAPQQTPFNQQPVQQAFSQPAVSAFPTSTQGFNAFPQTNQSQSQNLFNQQPFQSQQQNNLFPDISNTSPFDSGATPFQGDLLTPTVFGQENSAAPTTMTSSNSNGNLKLDSSLADLANLNLSSGRANQDFQPKTEKKLTGGSNYQQSVAPGMTMSMNSMNVNPMMNRMPMMIQQPSAGQIGMTQTQPMYNPNPMLNMQMSQQGYGHPIMGMQQPHNARPLNPNNPFGAM